jgi:putative ABC transport system permease protein
MKKNLQNLSDISNWQTLSRTRGDALSTTFKSVMGLLWREGLRTYLTMLGLIVGCTAFIALVNLQTLSSDIPLTLTMALLSIACVTPFLGCMAIMNTMLSAARERAHEIALQMAVGARPWDIRYQFWLEGVLLSLGAGLISIPLGIILTIILSGYIYQPFSANWIAIVMVPIATTVIGIIAGALPAHRAASTNIVNTIRGS